MSSYQDFKSFYQSNILLFIILLFVIVYIIINWTKLSEGNYLGGEYTKPILITGIIFLISHMLITWDDNTTNTDEKIIDIPKYKFQNNINNDQIKNDIVAATALPNPTTVPNPTIPNPTIPNPSTVPNPTIPNQANETFQQSLNNKYRIVKNNDINTNNNHRNFMNFANNYSNDDSRLSNRNIFISHKNSSKYGLKF